MAFTGTDVLKYEVKDRKVWITLNRPEAMNSFNAELSSSVVQAFEEYGNDDNRLVAILTGEGGRAFSAGADLKALAERQGSAPKEPPSPAPQLRKGGVQGVIRYGEGNFFDAIDSCSKPVIAAIDGYCLAGGFECALYCDIRVATRNSKFGLPEPRRSLLAGPGLINLSRMIPLGEALRWQLTGSHMSAERAYEMGLVAELCDDRERLIARADAIADEILECAPLAVQYIKQVVKVGRSLPVDQAWKYAEMFQAAIFKTEDIMEGPRAFAEKRKPNWTMR